MGTKKPVLTMSLLVSDRMDTVRRCLDSLKPIMEALPCELILTDTSKNPEIHELLLEYTDQVYRFEWCNDFSAARNVGLKKAKGEWFLFLDDDEWFTDIDDLVHFFNSGEYKKYGCANYIQRNYHDNDLLHYSDFWVSRMIRIDPDTTFKSKIHEYLYPVRGICRNVYIVANHTGYIYKTKADQRKHYERNTKLLLEMMEAEPDFIRWRVQLIQEYRSMDEFDKLEKLAEESIEYFKDKDDEENNRDLGTFYIGIIEGCRKRKRYEEGLQQCRRALDDKRNTDLCRAYVYLEMGTLYCSRKEYEEADKAIVKYFELEDYLLHQIKRSSYYSQLGALIVGDVFNEIPRKRAYSIRSICDLKRGSVRYLKEHLDQLEWNQPRIYLFDEILPAIVQAMLDQPEEPFFRELMQQVWNWANTTIQVKMMYEIQLWENRDKESYMKLLEILGEVEGAQWYLWYAKILIAEKNNDPQDMPYFFEKLIGSVFNRFMLPMNMFEIAEKFGIEMEEAFLDCPYQEWTEKLKEYVSTAALKDIEKLEGYLRRMQKREDIRFDYMWTRISEAKAIYTEDIGDFDKKRQFLQEFAENGSHFLQKYYQESVLRDYRELLPEYGHVALLIGEALEMELADETGAVEKYNEVKAVYSEFSDAIDRYISELHKETIERQWKAKKELRELQRKVRAEAEKLIAQERYQEALAVIYEMKKTMPDDLDVAELALRARLGLIQEG